MTLAQEHDIDLNQVEGSGRGGRITRKDLETIIRSGNIPSASNDRSNDKEEAAPSSRTETAASKQRTAVSSSVTAADGDIEIPVTGVRKAIAANMVKSRRKSLMPG